MIADPPLIFQVIVDKALTLAYAGLSPFVTTLARGRKPLRQGRSHNPWGEVNRRAQRGKSARCVRRGGGWKRGTAETV